MAMSCLGRTESAGFIKQWIAEASKTPQQAAATTSRPSSSRCIGDILLKARNAKATKTAARRGASFMMYTSDLRLPSSSNLEESLEGISTVIDWMKKDVKAPALLNWADELLASEAKKVFSMEDLDAFDLDQDFSHFEIHNRYEALLLVALLRVRGYKGLPSVLDLFPQASSEYEAKSEGTGSVCFEKEYEVTDDCLSERNTEVASVRSTVVIPKDKESPESTVVIPKGAVSNETFRTQLVYKLEHAATQDDCGPYPCNFLEYLRRVYSQPPKVIGTMVNGVIYRTDL